VEIAEFVWSPDRRCLEEAMKIPTTDSIRELAEFWDTHDLTECEDELEEAKDRVFERQRGRPCRGSSISEGAA